MIQLAERDVVQYDTGKTYMVSEAENAGRVLVTGWKNDKPFGALRWIDPARCTLIGKAIRPETNADKWRMVLGA